jgi:hypothetical protein
MPPIASSPLRQAVEQNRVVCSEHKHKVEPTLWEKVDGVVLEHHATRAHSAFELVHYFIFSCLVDQKSPVYFVTACVETTCLDELTNIDPTKAICATRYQFA